MKGISNISTKVARQESYESMIDEMRSVCQMSDKQIAARITELQAFAIDTDDKNREYLVIHLSLLLAKRIVNAK